MAGWEKPFVWPGNKKKPTDPNTSYEAGDPIRVDTCEQGPPGSGQTKTKTWSEETK